MVAERMAHKFIRHLERLEGVQLEDAFVDWCEVHFRRQEFMRLHGEAVTIHERERQRQIGPPTRSEVRLLGEMVPRLMDGTGG